MTPLQKFQHKALFNFTQRKSSDEVRAEVIGELHELVIDNVSYWYGNRELIASDNKFHTVWSLDTVNGINWIYNVIEDGEI